MEKYLNTQQVRSRYSGVTPKTLIAWKRDCCMPCTKIRGRCFYSEAELAQWEQRFKSPFKSEILTPSVRHRSNLGQGSRPLFFRGKE